MDAACDWLVLAAWATPWAVGGDPKAATKACGAVADVAPVGATGICPWAASWLAAAAETAAKAAAEKAADASMALNGG